MIEQFFATVSAELDSPCLNWKNVERAYTGRAYHNLDHLDEMLRHLPDHAPAGDRVVFGIALVYHDIVYKPTRQDNEERSARSVTKKLVAGGSLTDERIERCGQLILSTKQHLPSDTDDGDEALLIDLDLAVLARDPAGYDRYCVAVRKEFWMVPGFIFRKGRTKALTAFLNRPHIYHTTYDRDHYESPARENLWRELRSL